MNASPSQETRWQLGKDYVADQLWPQFQSARDASPQHCSLSRVVGHRPKTGMLQKGWNAVPAPAVADWRPNGTTRRGRKATEKSCRALNTYVGVSADVVFGGTVSWPFKVDRQKGWERNLARSTEQIFPDKWSSATLAMK